MGSNWTALSVIENGQIGVSLDRSLNTNPAGIKGANTDAVTVEIVGNFDIGGDIMLEFQKQSAVHLYACLADKFALPIDTEHIVYHHWYSSKGVKIVDFKTGKSISNSLLVRRVRVQRFGEMEIQSKQLKRDLFQM
ncbi:N-acetylmuramoyl-L-alanine amidase [Paenibacillus odorifer]|uniref:N-acetylmuramoyl-L-alanine amidase domain-containing protein n=1 Tax=Paenibacillus odorifer TaxID=189426 RepID=A0AAD0KKN0_9BACL|nr:N-acetylmuramoyl-L-alanine amidase [Paenibacillus odorifer]AWV34929.1 hypothetical protein CD191_21125 [Paenibacillus odorifer]